VTWGFLPEGYQPKVDCMLAREAGAVLRIRPATPEHSAWEENISKVRFDAGQ